MIDIHKDRISAVQSISDGAGNSGFGFCIYEKAQMTPCFYFVYRTPEEAETARRQVLEIINTAISYGVSGKAK